MITLTPEQELNKRVFELEQTVRALQKRVRYLERKLDEQTNYDFTCKNRELTTDELATSYGNKDSYGLW